MKRAAQRVNDLPQAGRDFALIQVSFEQPAAGVPPEVNSEDLRSAWLTLLARAAANRHHRITRAELSVREHMSRVLRKLQEAKYVEFRELFDPHQGVPVLVVTLLALLELARESLVELSQQAAYAPIYVSLKTGHLTAVH
jgi:segregation and condensation protein A